VRPYHHADHTDAQRSQLRQQHPAKRCGDRRILTPIIIINMLPVEEPGVPLPAGVWRPPFVVIGTIGMVWTLRGWS